MESVAIVFSTRVYIYCTDPEYAISATLFYCQKFTSRALDTSRTSRTQRSSRRSPQIQHDRLHPQKMLCSPLIPHKTHKTHLCGLLGFWPCNSLIFQFKLTQRRCNFEWQTCLNSSPACHSPCNSKLCHMLIFMSFSFNFLIFISTIMTTSPSANQRQLTNSKGMYHIAFLIFKILLYKHVINFLI